MQKIVNIEPTPNPNALKFILKSPLITKGTRSFRDFASATGDPLGSALFALGNVTSVFYMDKFVTVNKHATADWKDLIDPICEVIEETRAESSATISAYCPTFEADSTLQKIIDAIDSKIRPGLTGDGGDLEIISWDDKTLTIAYQGACGSCPAAGTSTLQHIERLLQREVDPLMRVEVCSQ